MKLWLLTPVKSLAEAKSRLASTLSLAERAALMHKLLAHLLATAQESAVLTGTIVVSRDPQVLTQAQAAGATPLQETGTGLNAALQQARTLARQRGADAVLVLPADLPLITAADVRTLYELAQSAPSIVLAPSRDGGTGALLLHPPELIHFAFGPDSFARHTHLARTAGVSPLVYNSPTLAFDVDRPADLAEFTDRTLIETK